MDALVCSRFSPVLSAVEPLTVSPTMPLQMNEELERDGDETYRAHWQVHTVLIITATMPTHEIQLHRPVPSSTRVDSPSKDTIPAASAKEDGTHHQILLPTTVAADVKPVHSHKKLSLIPLVFLIYFDVSGGPFGEEPAVQAAGPLYAILGFLVFSLIWSIPEALITAELSTAYPGNGGYVIWASEAFGPFWGFMMGWWKWLSGAINTAAYPVLCADYLKLVVPALSAGPYRYLMITVFNIVFAFLNYTGLTIVGWTAVALAGLSLAPFILLLFISIPKIRPSRWLNRGEGKKDWSLYFNTLFWNLNFWDNASTLAGEVDRPHKTYPKALLMAWILTCLCYLIPLLAGIGALENLDQAAWSDGYLADVARILVGHWLKYWVEIGAVFSAVGLFQAQLSSCSFQLLGMADLGILPAVFARRSRWFNTPTWGILFSTVVTVGLSYMNFASIISSSNFLYSLGMLLEFSAFVWLRWRYPTVRRPFRVPVGVPGLICMCLVPTAFVIMVMVLAGKLVFSISGGFTLFGIICYFVIKHCKVRNWVPFIKIPLTTHEEDEKEEGKDYHR